jgi:hypothetical protein
MELDFVNWWMLWKTPLLSGQPIIETWVAHGNLARFRFQNPWIGIYCRSGIERWSKEQDNIKHIR